MSAGSLDILKNRVQSAVEETKILRAENERLKAQLEEVIAERTGVPGTPAGLIARDRLAGNGFDPDDIRKRLQALVKRIDRLEKRMSVKER